MKNRAIRLTGALAAVVLSLVQATSIFAWGPERPTYTNKSPADHATFNSITDNPVFGDERDFVRIVEKKGEGETKDTYSNDLTLETGKQYEVVIYYHNNASSTVNDAAHNYAGMAYNAKVIANFPRALKKDEKGQVSAIITAEGTDPESVWDEAYVTASEAMTLHYVTASAKIHNDWDANGSTMSVHMFGQEGDYLGVNELNGVIPGCYEFSGYVTYTIQTVADGDPIPDDVVDPTPEEEKPTTPVLPSELPKTGPMEITLIVIVAVLAIVALGYAIHARRAAHKAAKSRKNKGSKKK